jgi:hypothetical protein
VPLRGEVDQLRDLRVSLLLHRASMNFPHTSICPSRSIS